MTVGIQSDAEWIADIAQTLAQVRHQPAPRLPFASDAACSPHGVGAPDAHFRRLPGMERSLRSFGRPAELGAATARQGRPEAMQTLCPPPQSARERRPMKLNPIASVSKPQLASTSKPEQPPPKAQQVEVAPPIAMQPCPEATVGSEDTPATQPPVQIVEASIRVAVQLDDGVQVPARLWLVLETLGAQGDERGQSRQLARSLGGGFISPQAAAALKPVPRQRLHKLAAEANFQRAARGTCHLALRHAALALQLLGDRVRDVQLPFGEVSESRQPCTGKQDPLSRVRRAEQLVTTRARKLNGRVSASAMEASDEGPPLELGRGRHHGMRSKMLRKGLHTWLEFLQFARHRFGNTARAWFRMDLREKLSLTEKEFVRGCEEVGFRGNLPALWRYLDSDRTGTVSIMEMDPAVGEKLASFRKFLVENNPARDGSVGDGFQLLDQNRNNRCYKSEFKQRLRALGYSGELANLFELLDRDGYGCLVEHNLHFLQQWTPLPYLFCEPSFEALKAWKEDLKQVHGYPLAKAWRKVLDRDCTMRVTWHSFVVACSGLAASKNTPPMTEAQMCAVWKALDDDSNNWISLSEFDPECYEVFASFKRWAEDVYGSCCDAFRDIDASTSQNGKLSTVEMRQVIGKCEKAWTGDLEWLFLCLDWNDTQRVTKQDFLFLDHWDLDGEEWEVTVRKWAMAPGGAVRAVRSKTIGEMP